MAKTKRITLHPLREDGSIDLTTNLYPKTLKDGIVDETGKEVSIQDELVSGENIKTINGESILGSGNIEIEVPTGEFVDTTTNQDVGGDKTFIDIATFEDDVVFKGALIDKESNQVEIKEISKATNLENGTGNGSLIQTNATLDSGNEWSSANSSIATVVDGLVYTVALTDSTSIEWVSSMKDLISYDEVEEVPIFTNGLEVELTSIIDSNGDTFFQALTDQAGKCVVVNEYETGFEYKDPSSFMTQLTHSFNELDETLQGIVEDAITDGGTDGVACSEAQWSSIKALLDISLYISYNGLSLIKAVSDGISVYVFGSAPISLGIAGALLQFNYNDSDAILNAIYTEV